MPGADLTAEGDGIHVAGIHGETVAVVGRDQDGRPGPRGEVGFEHPAKAGEVGVQRAVRAGRRVVAPDQVDEAVGAHRAAGGERERGEDAARLAGGEGNRALRPLHARAPKDPDPHEGKR